MPSSRRPSGALSLRAAIAVWLATTSVAFSAGPPSIVEGRVLWSGREKPGEALGFEVSSVRSGFVAASILELRWPDELDGCGGGSRAALATAAEQGWTLELVLHPGTAGTWRIDCARRSSPPDFAAFAGDRAPLSAPLASAATIGDLAHGGTRRRLGSAVTTPTFEQEVVRLVNVLRQSNGNLPPLKQQSQLDSSAATHSQNMGSRDFFAHCDVDTATLPWDRMDDAGYTGWSYAGENIHGGSSQPSGAVTSWENSPPHLANMLQVWFRELGVGYFADNGDTANVRRDTNSDCVADSFGNGPYVNYWTQNFGWRNGAFPVVIEREAHVTTSSTVTLYLYGTTLQYTGDPNELFRILPWAQEMRFSNDGGTWSTWEPYAPDKTWTLSPGNGTKTVWAQVRNGGQTLTSTDTIELDGACSVTLLEDDVLTGTQTIEDCEIHAGPSLEVEGDVTFLASLTVLRSGFSVASGGQLTVGAPP